MLLAEFEPAITVSGRPQTYNLNRATAIFGFYIISIIRLNHNKRTIAAWV
jgi:hypothetical protein